MVRIYLKKILDHDVIFRVSRVEIFIHVTVTMVRDDHTIADMIERVYQIPEMDDDDVVGNMSAIVRNHLRD